MLMQHCTYRVIYIKCPPDLFKVPFLFFIETCSLECWRGRQNLVGIACSSCQVSNQIQRIFYGSGLRVIPSPSLGLSSHHHPYFRSDNNKPEAGPRGREEGTTLSNHITTARPCLFFPGQFLALELVVAICSHSYRTEVRGKY
jgi:hypothetical protein